MLLAGLTGGIGSGKSTFASLLLERGAQILDADEIARAALEPGQPAWHSVVDTFGDEIVVEGTMQLDRHHLADIVFNDRDKLAALNAIVHPVIMSRIADVLDDLRGTREVVVIDAALLFEVGLHEGVELTIVVTADEEVRRRRLLEGRGMRPKDVEARMAAQRDLAEHEKRADIVVRNDGDMDALNEEADKVWALLMERLNA